VNAACPFASSVTICNTVLLSRNVTEPEAVPDPGALTETVAVKVTGWPATVGSAEDVSAVVVASLFTVWVKDVELAEKLASPPYAAVMRCDPIAKVEVLQLARPLASSDTVASAVEPSLKVTLDVGTPLPGEVAVTVAVNVTCWPNTEVEADELTCVLVAALFTTCGATVSLPLLFAHPLVPAKLAVIVCEPTGSAEVLKEAWPEASMEIDDASTVAPSRNVTVPVGVPEPDVTVAVKVTAWPNTAGFGDDPTAVVVVAPD